MLFPSEKKSEYFNSKFDLIAKSYDTRQRSLYISGRIPFAQTYTKKVEKQIKDFKLIYYLFNEIQQDENKKTYLITITNSMDMRLVSTFIKKLNEVKKDDVEFLYFSILEPTKTGIPHIHIKLIIDNKRGIYTKISNEVKKLEYSMTNIKKQGVDKKNYLLKCLSPQNIKEYIGWLDSIDVSLAKSVKKSMWIKIDDNLKISLSDYKLTLSQLLKNRRTNKRIGLKEVGDYLINLQPELRKLKPLSFKEAFRKLHEKFTPSTMKRILHEVLRSSDALKTPIFKPRVSYIYNNQVELIDEILLYVEIRDKSPPFFKVFVN